MDLAVFTGGNVKIRFGSMRSMEFTTGTGASNVVMRTDSLTGHTPGIQLASLPILVPGLIHKDDGQMEQAFIPFVIRISLKSLFGSLFSSEYIINQAYLLIFAALSIFLGAILVLVVMIGFGLAGGITRSISLLRKGTYEISQGNLSARIHLKSRDELGQLAGSFNSMVADLSRMLEEIKDKERLEGELEAARAIQLKLLPQIPPEIAGYLIAATSLPAKQVGGDYYDFLPEPLGRTSVAVGDVCGKGMPAALLMANLQASLRALCGMDLPLAEMTCRMNQLMHRNTEAEQFITFFVCRYDPTDRTLTYVNAGHNHPLLVQTNGQVRALDQGGLILGPFADAAYEQETLTLSLGDVLLLYTDGVSEAMNANEEELGEARMREIVRKHAADSSRGILEAVEALLKSHQAADQPEDDQTLLVAKVI
jgi:sigma-B regulation protein RsbU (phosphoserine phosphatase)